MVEYEISSIRICYDGHRGDGNYWAEVRVREYEGELREESRWEIDSLGNPRNITYNVRSSFERNYYFEVIGLNGVGRSKTRKKVARALRFRFSGIEKKDLVRLTFEDEVGESKRSLPMGREPDRRDYLDFLKVF